MPIPAPNTGEEKNEYMGRCMSFMKGEKEKYPTHEQRVAICLTTFSRKSENVIGKIDMILEARRSEDEMKNIFNKNKKVIQKIFDKEMKKEEKALGHYQRELQTRQGDDYDPNDFEEEEIEAERTAVTNTLVQAARKIKDIKNDSYWKNFFMRFLVG